MSRRVYTWRSGVKKFRVQASHYIDVGDLGLVIAAMEEGMDRHLSNTNRRDVLKAMRLSLQLSGDQWRYFVRDHYGVTPAREQWGVERAKELFPELITRD